MSTHKRNLVIAGGVTLSVIVSPVVAAVTVGQLFSSVSSSVSSSIKITKSCDVSAVTFLLSLKISLSSKQI